MVPIEQGEQAPGFDLQDVDGKARSLEDIAGAKAQVIGFVAGDCEKSRAYEGRIAELAGAYGDRAAFAVVDVRPDAGGLDRLRDAGKILYLDDPDQETVQAYEVQKTPHLFVFEDLRLLYAGRFDDAWRDPKRVMRSYVREALEVVFEERDHLEIDRTIPIGTPIS